VPLPDRPLRPADLGLLEVRFHEMYRRRYGRQIDGVAVEAVTFRVTVTASPARRGLPRWRRPRGATALRDRRRVHFPGGWVTGCPVYDRYALAPGTTLRGPAVVEERESTTVAPPRSRLRVDRDLNLVIVLDGGARS